MIRVDGGGRLLVVQVSQVVEEALDDEPAEAEDDQEGTDHQE